MGKKAKALASQKSTALKSAHKMLAKLKRRIRHMKKREALAAKPRGSVKAASAKRALAIKDVARRAAAKAASLAGCRRRLLGSGRLGRQPRPKWCRQHRRRRQRRPNG